MKKPVKTPTNAEIIALKAKDNTFIIQIPRTAYWLYCSRLSSGWKVFLVRPNDPVMPETVATRVSTRTLSKIASRIINKNVLVHKDILKFIKSVVNNKTNAYKRNRRSGSNSGRKSKGSRKNRS